MNIQHSTNLFNLSIKSWQTSEINAHAAISKELFKNDELSIGVFYDKNSLGKQEDKGLPLKYRKFFRFPRNGK